MRLDLGEDLATLKLRLQAQVDAEAEALRLRYITPGSGQAMEYKATEDEARRFVVTSGADIADYPFLKAEVDAQALLSGFAVDPQLVALQVIGEADLWTTIGAEIKRLRRMAKMAIEQAETVADARRAARVSWPQPG